MTTEPLGRMRTGTSLGRTLYLLGPDDDLAANPKAGTFIGMVDTPELAEAICAAVNAAYEAARTPVGPRIIPVRPHGKA